MSFVCPICRDLVGENGSSSGESEIVAGECGHLFHRKCITTWIEYRQGTESRNKCPCCRGSVTLSKLITLYPTASNQLSSLEGADKSVELLKQVHNLSITLTSLREENVSKDFSISNLTERVKMLAEENQKLSLSAKTWIKRSEQSEKYKSLYTILKAKHDRLPSMLQGFKSADIMLNSKQPNTADTNTTQGDVQSIGMLMEENKKLSESLLEAHTHIERLEAQVEELNVLYLDSCNQLREFINN